MQSVRVAGNVGFGILPDPVRGDRQNDVLEYGVSVARAVQPGVELVGELNGRKNTRSGTRRLSAPRAGRWCGWAPEVTRGTCGSTAALLLGITEFDPSWGFTGGVTWVFKAFDVQ